MPDATPQPKSLRAQGDSLFIEWSDGATHRLSWRLLRDRCPCATCRDQRAHPRPASPFAILKPEEARPLRPTSVKPVGNYAYAIDFSDGHNTGIYSLEFLYELGSG